MHKNKVANMRFTFIFTLLMLSAGGLFSQQKEVDSLKHLLASEKSDSSRINALWEISRVYMTSRPDSALLAAQQGLFIARNSNDKVGEMMSLQQMANVYQVTGNYSQSLTLYLRGLKLNEEHGDPARTVATLISIAHLYQMEGDYGNALSYAKKGDSLISEKKLDDYKWNSYLGFGDLYEKMDSVQKSFTYNGMAYQLAVQGNDSAMIGMSLNNTANIYSRSGQPDTAVAIYFQAIPYLVNTHNESFLCETYQGIAAILFKKKGQSASAEAIKYARKSFEIADGAGLNKKYIISCQLLTAIYRSQNKIDSAFIYQDRMITMKDAVYSSDKIKQVENLTIEEKLRQNELAEKIKKEEEARKHNLQLLMIGMLIPLFFFLSVMLSKRKINAKLVEFAGIFSLLLLFEYLTLLLHPRIVKLTNDTPLLEIIILVLLAGILTPAHHRMEQWMVHNLTKTKKQDLKTKLQNDPDPGEEI